MKAFECKLCGECCYGEGGITLEKQDIERISGFMGIPQKAFIAEYCIEKNGKVSIISGTDGYCIFFDQEKACRIHEAKPAICSLWPFYPAIIKDRHTWEMAKYGCPGLDHDCTFEEFIEQSNE